MILEQPELGSDPPNGSGRERGATSDVATTFNMMSSLVEAHYDVTTLSWRCRDI